jgi:hypothetical protein
LSFDWTSFCSAIIAGSVGGLITGYFMLRSTQKSFDNQKEQLELNEAKLIKGLLQAIHDEVETLLERYQDTMGPRLDSLKDGEVLAYYYPLMSDYFTVYDGNSFLIGRIPDNDLRKQIIKSYTLAKAMIDSFRFNNDLLQKYEHSLMIFQETQQELHKQRAQAYYQSLVEYAKRLKQGHDTLKQETLVLLRTLRKYGVLNEVNN